MKPGYPSTVSRQSSERPSSWERQEFYDVTVLEIRNSNKESTISRFNMSIEHRKRTNQKRVENIVISDFVEPNVMNFVERTLKQHRKELIKFKFRTHRMIVKKNQSEKSFRPSKINVEIEKNEKSNIKNKFFG